MNPTTEELLQETIESLKGQSILILQLANQIKLLTARVTDLEMKYEIQPDTSIQRTTTLE
ncbi:MAG: hypothetical protein ACRDBG_09840 [Waterburya sp.]